jgi:hypothetical protein
MQKVNPENAKVQPNISEDPHGLCEKCDVEMKFSPIEALFFCDQCGFQEFVLIDSDKPSYKDPPREVTYYAYKRINHFNEWLAQFQAKESTEIPEDIFQAILEELKKERIVSVEDIKQVKIREILKKLKCTNFYEHVPYILNRINGKTAPVMSREIEEKLRYWLGVKQVVWLSDGLEGDDTDGHVDDLTRFLAPGVVSTVVEPDTKDVNHTPLAENLERLRHAKDAKGQHLKVIEMPMPPRADGPHHRNPASHANFYIGNAAVLVPIFNSPTDKIVLQQLQPYFPDRQVVGIDCQALVGGLGAIHCITQQMPAI